MTGKRENLARNAIHAMSILNFNALHTESGCQTDAEFAMRATM